MKKNLSRLALILALAMTLSGCSGKTAPTGTITPAPAAQETTAPAETEAPTVSLGRMVGGIYENAYVGYGCTLDENWEYYTAEELQDLSDLTQEMLQDTELMGEKHQQLLDMVAENATDLTSVNIVYSYTSLQDRLASALFTEEQYVDGVLGMKDQMADAYAQSGITLHTMEKKQVSFLGQERWAIHSDATIAGDGADIPYYILQLFEKRPNGSYLVTLTLASYMEDNTESLLDLFYPVSE